MNATKKIYALKCLSANLIAHQDTSEFEWVTNGCNGCKNSEFCSWIKSIVNIEIVAERRGNESN